MAIYHFRVKTISRSKGRSAVASAAYRRADKLFDERQQSYKDYRHKQDVIYSEILVPSHAPSWIESIADLQKIDKTQAAEKLWNRVEAHEKRHDAQLAREIVFALPIELNPEQAIVLAREFIHDQFVLRGMIADFNVHWDQGNPHVHVMLTMRELTPEGFGKKVRAWNHKVLLKEWRKQWADYTNYHLCLHQHAIRIDHRSYKDQGIDLIPGIHQGKAVNDMERRGIPTHIMKEANHIRQQNLKHIFEKPEVLLDKMAHQQAAFTAEQMVGELSRYVNDKGHFSSFENTSRESTTLIASGSSAIVREEVLRHLSDSVINQSSKPQFSAQTLLTILNQIEHHESIFTERELAKAISPYTQYAGDFAKALIQLKTSEHLIYVGVGEDGRDRYTTRKMFHVENRIQSVADQLRERKHFSLSSQLIDKTLAAYQQRIGEALTEEQINAVRYVLKNNAIACLVGRAGTGKSFSLGAAKEVWEAKGLRVLGVALSGIAADGLMKDAGIKSQTIESFRYALEKEALILKARDVVVMDEAGMTDSMAMEAVLSAIEKARAKIVLVGDHAQIQPVGPGATFRALLERLGFSEIQTVFRQKEEWQRKATVALSGGFVAEALDAYRARDGILFETDLDKAMLRLVADWRKAQLVTQKPLENFLIIAYRNEDVTELNQLARLERVQANEIEAGYLAETASGNMALSQDERILFLKNNKKLGVSNGRFATITHLKTNDLGHVTYITAQLDGKEAKTVSFDMKQYNQFTYGYAATVHKSQGLTVDHSFILAGGKSWNRNLTYVAMSRHRYSCQLYADKITHPNLEALKKHLGRLAIKDSVLDFPWHFAERRGLDTDSLLGRLQQHLKIKLSHIKQSLVDRYEEIILPNRYWQRKEQEAKTKQEFSDTIARREDARLVAAYVDANQALGKAWEVLNNQLNELGFSRLDYKSPEFTLISQHPTYHAMQDAIAARDQLAAQIYRTPNWYSKALEIYAIPLPKLAMQAEAHQCRERVKAYQQELLKGRTIYRDKLAAEIAAHLKSHYAAIHSLGLDIHTIRQQAKAHARRQILAKLSVPLRNDFKEVERYYRLTQIVARSYHEFNSAYQQERTISHSFMRRAEQLSYERDALAAQIYQNIERYQMGLDFYEIGLAKPPIDFTKPSDKAIQKANARWYHLQQQAAQYTIRQRVHAYNTALLSGDTLQRQSLAHEIMSDIKAHHGAIASHSLAPAATWLSIRQDAKAYTKNVLLNTLTPEEKTNFMVVENYVNARNAARESWQEIFTAKEHQALSEETLNQLVTPIAKSQSILRDQLAAQILENPAHYQIGLDFYHISLEKLNKSARAHQCREQVIAYQHQLNNASKQTILERAQLAHTICEDIKAHYPAFRELKLDWKQIYKDARIIDRQELFNELFYDEKRNLRLLEYYQKANRQAGRAWTLIESCKEKNQLIPQKRYHIAQALTAKRDYLASRVIHEKALSVSHLLKHSIQQDKLHQQAERHYGRVKEVQAWHNKREVSLQLLKQFSSSQDLTKKRIYSDWLVINREIRQLAQPLIKHPMRYRYALSVFGFATNEPMVYRHYQSKLEQALNKDKRIKLSPSKNVDKTPHLDEQIDAYVKRLVDFQSRDPIGQAIKEIQALEHTIQKSVGEDKRLAEKAMMEKLASVARNRELYTSIQKQYPQIDKLLQLYKPPRHKPKG